MFMAPEVRVFFKIIKVLAQQQQQQQPNTWLISPLSFTKTSMT